MPMDLAGLANWITFKLSRDVRVVAQPLKRFSGFVKPEPNFGPNMSLTYQYTLIGNLLSDGAYIGEYGDVPKTEFPIFKGSLTAAELTQSVDTTWQASTVVELNTLQAMVVGLMNSASRLLDKVAAAAFQSADVIYTPTGTESSKTGTFAIGTTTPGATATRGLKCYDLKNIVDQMKNPWNVPGFGGGDMYVGIASVLANRTLKDDSEFIELKRYADPKQALKGEMGGYYQVRTLVETNALNNNMSGGLGEMIIFGDDPCIEIEIEPLQIQSSYDPNYGRFKGLRYMWFGGIEKTWQYTYGAQVRIVRIASN